MKKLLIAAAALAAGGAMAQSSVTIWGVVDQSLAYSNAGTSPSPGRGPANAWGLKNGRQSMLVFSGREDLGGGNYARFELGHYFAADSGTPSTPFFSRRSIIALGGSWGEAYAGREYVPSYWVGWRGDPSGHNYVSQFGQLFSAANFNGSLQDDGSQLRHSNMVGYRTPTVLGGLKGEVSLGLRETMARNNAKGFSLVWDKKPLYVGVGGNILDADNRMYVTTAAYDFGIIHPRLTVADARGGYSTTFAPTPNYRARSYTASAGIPIGPHHFYFGVGNLDIKSAANQDVRKVMVGYEHFLSKSTRLYVNAASSKQQNLTRTTSYDAGISKAF